MTPDTKALAKLLKEIDHRSRIAHACNAGVSESVMNAISSAKDVPTLLTLATWALEARAELEKIAKPALGGKMQQQRAQTILATFPLL